MADTFLYDNAWGDYSSVSMTNEDSDYPKENLDKLSPKIVAKSTGVTTRIVIDMGSAIAIKGIAFANSSNFSVRKNLEANVADAWGAPPEDAPIQQFSRTVNGTTYYWHVCEAPGNDTWGAYRYWSIDVEVGSGVCQLGVPMLFLENYDLVKGWGTPSYMIGKEKHFQMNPGAGGDFYRRRKWSRTIVNMTFRGLLAAQVSTFDDELGEMAYCYLLTNSNVYYGMMEFDVPIITPDTVDTYDIVGMFTESSFF